MVLFERMDSGPNSESLKSRSQISRLQLIISSRRFSSIAPATTRPFLRVFEGGAAGRVRSSSSGLQRSQHGAVGSKKMYISK